MIREAHHGGLHEEFKRRIKTQTVLPSAETAAMLFWAVMASGQIAMRKVDGWRSPAERPSDLTIDLAASSSNLSRRRSHQNNFQPLPRLHLPTENARLNDETEAVHRIIEKMRLMTPLSSWQTTCRLPPFWAKSGFAFK